MLVKLPIGIEFIERSKRVRNGQAIAYLPDFLLREWQLTQLEISDHPTCVSKKCCDYFT